MTHAECQDLLLELAYGELDAARAAEVQAHLAGCADCQRGQAQMAETRRMASPLRAVEEPSERFDARIMAAARAEASLQSDGLPGQVIEVKGTVSPMGLTAARIDAHAAVTAAPAKRKPRWALRVALGGSAAAAAALALVVSTTRKVEHAPAARYEIETGKIAEKAQREAIARAEVARKAEAPVPAAAAPAPAEPEVAAAPEPRPQAARKSAKAKAAVKDDQVQALLGSGGDAADELALHDSAVRGAPAASAGAGAAHGVVARTDAPAPVSTGARAEMKQLAKAAPAAADDVNAGSLESQAQEARHAGNYLLAASLYRKAAALRRSANAIALRQAAVGSDPGTAAWDLAHAVECLAAAGLFDEARQVRAELMGLYPSENTPITAANRALRAGDTPAAPVTAPDEKRPGTAPAVDH